MLAASLAVLMGLSGLSTKGQSSLDSDVRLRAPITLRLKCVALSSMADALGRATKVPLKVSPDIAQRKVTAIFHDRPASEFMKALETALMMQWKRSGNGFTLTLPLKVEREEAEQLESESNAYRAGLEEGISALRAAAGLSEAERATRTAEIGKKMSALISRSDDEAQKASSALIEDQMVLRNLPMQSLVSAIGMPPAKLADALLGGTVLCASSRPQDGLPVLGSGFMDRILKQNPEAVGALALMRFSEEHQYLEGRTIAASSDPRRGSTVSGFFTYTPLLHHSVGLKSSRLLAQLQKWSSMKDPKVLSQPVAVDGPKEPDPGYFSRFGGGVTLTEHLEFLADHADIPVIGDAFRVFCSGPGFAGGGTVESYITSLTKSTPPMAGRDGPTVSYVASQNGWLMARHSAYWRRISAEVPEDALSALEHAATAKDRAAIDDYAAFAVGLTPAQVRSFTHAGYTRAVRFDVLPLEKTIPSLQLWGSLTDVQRQQAKISAGPGTFEPGQAQKGFDLAALTPIQAQIVLLGWSDKMWNGEVSSLAWPAFFSPKGLANSKTLFDLREFSFGGASGTRPGPAPARVGLNGRQRRPGMAVPNGAAMLQGAFEYHLAGDVQITDTFVVSSTHPSEVK